MLNPVTAAAIAQHPTRQAPLCSACTHRVLIAGITYPRCNHPSTPVHADTGLPKVACVALRDRCDPGAGFAHCGPDGLLFEAAPAVAQINPAAWLIAPRIGTYWAGQGGIYAGVARGIDGAPDHHLILCATEPAADGLQWQAAMDWAASLQDGSFSDWALPNRTESALLFTNVRTLLAEEWHWTSEEFNGSFAWDQYFFTGTQGNDDKSCQARARAVRRLPIQSFDPS